MSSQHDHDHLDDHDRGLSFDLPQLLDRRRVLLLAGAGLLTLAGCGGDDAPAGTSAAATSAPGTTAAAAAPSTAASSAAATSAAADGTCAVLPEETAGPYPGDGSNGPDVLAQSGVVRQDIRSSFAGATGVADGIPLALSFTITDAACAPLEGAALYAWHCDRDGRYSMYSDGVTEENYLRGVQEAGADGVVTFSTIFPGCYAGRWPHVHFEVYESATAAAEGAEPIATSQLAFPADSCAEAYASAGYETSAQNLAGVSLASDMVFADGAELQTAAMAGSAADGYTATLAVPVQA